MTTDTFIADLAVVLVVATFTSIVMRRFRQSSVLGYLLAGTLVGPYIPLPFFADSDRVHTMAQFGVVLVMFAIGLEFRIGRFFKVLPVSGLTALLQMSFLFWCGLSFAMLLGWSPLEAIFLGGAVAISSTMVVSKVLDQHAAPRPLREFLLGVLVIQDLAAVLLLAVLTGVASGQGLETETLLATIGRLALVLLALVVVGILFVPRLVRMAADMKSPEILVVVITGICFGTAVAAEEMGYSVALGAFVAGVLVAESGREQEIGPVVGPLKDLFGAIFFVSIGMEVDPVAAWAVLPQSLALVAVIIGGQFVIVSLAGLISGAGLNRSLVSGLALGQIGEFAFIIAGVGLQAGIVRTEALPMLVAVAILTAFTTPLIFGRSSAIAAWVGRNLPASVAGLLALYEQWFESWRSGATGTIARPSVRRAVRVVGIDAAVLIGLSGAAVLERGELTSLLESWLALPADWVRIVLLAAWLAVLTPFFVSLVRNTSQLARLISCSVVTAAEAGARPVSPLLQGLYRLLIWLAVLLGVGLPLSVLLQPIVGAAPVALLVIGLASAGGIYLWRGCGDEAGGIRSQAERVARLLGRQAAERRGQSAEGPARIPGFDLVFGVTIPEHSGAVGKTLIDLNLRARTGATVVAIRRGGENLLLPTGREQLQAGDVLGIAGTHEAIEKATALFGAL